MEHGPEQGMTIREMVEEIRSDVKTVNSRLAAIERSIPHFVTWGKLAGVVVATTTILFALLGVIQ